MSCGSRAVRVAHAARMMSSAVGRRGRFWSGGLSLCGLSGGGLSGWALWRLLWAEEEEAGGGASGSVDGDELRVGTGD